MKAESPRDAVEETLRLLARELDDTGFEVAPGLLVRRKSGDLTQLLSPQMNKHNRAGEQARFGLSASLESAALGAWMKQRYPDRPASITRFDHFVTARQLTFPGTPHHAEWDVVDPVTRPSVAAEAAGIVRASVLPWLELVSDPSGALRTLLDGSLHPSVIRYAVATGHSDEARRRVVELREQKSAFRETLERLRRDGRPPAFRNGLEPIVWAAIEAGVA